MHERPGLCTPNGSGSACDEEHSVGYAAIEVFQLAEDDS